MRISFGKYLERRQVGDVEAAGLLKTCPAEVLTAESWGEAMRHLTRSRADPSYVLRVRDFWQEYARANARLG